MPHQFLRDIKRIGVTDLIILDSQRGTILWNSKKCNAVNDPTFKGKEILNEIIKAACQNNLQIWIGFHATGGRHIIPVVFKALKELWARDANGFFYQPLTLDVFNPKTLKYWYTLIDEISEINACNSVMGIFWDEVWFNSSDLFGDNFSEFMRFCNQKFKEIPPIFVKKKFEKEEYRHFQKNVWWRRYALFRQYANYSFLKSINEHAKKRGFRIIHRPMHAGCFKKGWIKISLPHALLKLCNKGDYTWTSYKWCDSELYDNSIICIYLRNSRKNWGLMCSKSLQGVSVCAYTYEYIAFQEGNIKNRFKEKWTKGLINHLRTRLKRFYEISKKWQGAKRIYTAGILTYQNGICLRFKNPQWIFKKNEKMLLNFLRNYYNVRIVHVEDEMYLKRCPLLIAPFYVTRYLPYRTLRSLLNYVSQGGYILSFSTKWSTSAQDLTEERDQTQNILKFKVNPAVERHAGLAFRGRKIYGTLWGHKVKLVSPSVKVMAHFLDGTPAIIFTPWGKGGIITLNFSIEELANNDQLQALFKTLIKQFSPPFIESDGRLKIMSVLQKEGKFLISLYAPYQFLPRKGVIRINGLTKMYPLTKLFRVNYLIAGQSLYVKAGNIQRIEAIITPENQYEVLTIEPCT